MSSLRNGLYVKGARATIVELNTLPILVQFLEDSQLHHLAAGAIANIALCEELVIHVYESGALPRLIALAQNGDVEVCEGCIHRMLMYVFS